MKKRGLLLLILISTVFIGGIMGRFLWKPQPAELLTHGLEKLNQATSFRYSITQHQWVEGKDRVTTQILGEKDGGNTHISGQLVGTDVEMVVAGGGFYLKDPLGKKWVKYPSVPATQEVFLAELNPISSLQFKELGEVMLKGQEKLNGQKVWVIQLQPSVQNQMMEDFWKDFNYTVYLSTKDKTIRRATIEAKSKAKSEPMSMTLDFSDFGQKISVQPPNL